MSAPTSTQVINVFRYTALALGFYTGVTTLCEIKNKASVRDEILAKQHLIAKAKKEYNAKDQPKEDIVKVAAPSTEEVSLETLIDNKDFDLGAYLEEKAEKL